ncbi:MAG: hypothetical protein R6V49_02280 [Bacteroidales bacterium]
MNFRSLIPFVLTTLLSGFFFNTGRAQQAYFSLGAAHCFGNGGIVHQMFEQSTISGDEISLTAKRLTLGHGNNYRGDLRFYPDDYFGIGIQGTIFRGSWQHFSSERKIVYVQRTGRSVRARGFSIALGIHGKLGDETLMPYISLFPGFFLGTLDLMDTVSYAGLITTSRWEYQNLNSFFCNVAAGIDIVITRELVAFVELEYQSMTIAPDRGVLLIRDGNNKLEDIPVNEKVIVFRDQITNDYTQVPDETKPRQDLKPYFPLDNFQIRIGLRLPLLR